MGLNLSILDGWWAEGYDGSNGFAIGDEQVDADPAVQDARDGKGLLEALGGRSLRTLLRPTGRRAPSVAHQGSGPVSPRFPTFTIRIGMVADYVRDLYIAAVADGSA